jgi:tetratricopeptide (TPR) repeat protein
MYYIRSENWQKCVEEYSNLLQQYPADNIGQNNLAGCYASLHNMPKALEEARRAVQLAPKDLMAQVNFSLDACYAGDFETCAQQGREIQRLNPLYEEGYLVLAYAQLGQEQLPQASETYQKLEKLGARGASLAASGRANLAVYQGKYQEAVQILDKAIAADVAAKAPDQAADNLAILAYAELSRGEKQAAIVAAEKALAQSQSNYHPGWRYRKSPKVGRRSRR